MTHPNNKGLTLIELLCTIALFSLIGLAAMSMMTVVARMNHAVALQEKQAREAEVVIETVKYQLLRHPSTYTPSENEDGSGTIQIEGSDDDENRILAFVTSEENGKVNLYMTIGKTVDDNQSQGGISPENPEESTPENPEESTPETLPGASIEPISRSLLANDLDPENGFSIVPETTGELMDQTVSYYTITLRYANGNEFQWIISPRLSPTSTT